MTGGNQRHQEGGEATLTLHLRQAQRVWTIKGPQKTMRCYRIHLGDGYSAVCLLPSFPPPSISPRIIPESNPAAWISQHASVILSSKDAALQGFYCEGQRVEKIKKQHQTKQKPFKPVKKLSHRNSSCQSRTHFMPQMWHLELDSNLLRIRIANCDFLSNCCLLF